MGKLKKSNAYQIDLQTMWEIRKEKRDFLGGWEQFGSLTELGMSGVPHGVVEILSSGNVYYEKMIKLEMRMRDRELRSIG